MNRSREHIDGYRRGSKDAVAWLMNWAQTEAHDPHAKQIVYMLAAHMGDHLKRVAGMAKTETRPEHWIGHESERDA